MLALSGFQNSQKAVQGSCVSTPLPRLRESVQPAVMSHDGRAGARRPVNLRSAWSTQSSRSDRAPHWDPVYTHPHHTKEQSSKKEKRTGSCSVDQAGTKPMLLLSCLPLMRYRSRHHAQARYHWVFFFFFFLSTSMYLSTFSVFQIMRETLVVHKTKKKFKRNLTLKLLVLSP